MIDPLVAQHAEVPARQPGAGMPVLGIPRAGAGRKPDFVSVFDLFRVGIGPSSSHTVGPMRAAAQFATQAADYPVARVDCVLYGALASTGPGHGTPGALLAGLAGHTPEQVHPHTISDLTREVADRGVLRLAGRLDVHLPPDWLTLAPRERLPRHPNALRLRGWSTDDQLLLDEVYYSVGGGFIEREGSTPQDSPAAPASGLASLPYPFTTSAELVQHCEREHLSVAALALANEAALRGARKETSRRAGENEASQRGEETVRQELHHIWAVMNASIEAGLQATGVLPGPLHTPRRAAEMARRLRQAEGLRGRDASLEWLQAYAIAVGEQNAAGERVVTAPTNGAAGIVPAVLRYALDVLPAEHDDLVTDYLLVAGAIGALFKNNASISGAEAGCQGEVGSACSMAAAGFCHLLGGTPAQVENAAEIAMEHNLGLTCDPVAGLVQVPCIERNAIAAGKAVAAARMAMNGDGRHMVSLDTVIETMRQTGQDMSAKYKETSQGGLAVNVVEC